MRTWSRSVSAPAGAVPPPPSDIPKAMAPTTATVPATEKIVRRKCEPEYRTDPAPRELPETAVEGASDLQEAADREAGPSGAEQQAEADQDHPVPQERERVRVARVVDVAEDRRQRDLLAEKEQQDGDCRAGDSADQPLEHERPADEPVRGSDELHHLDLTAPREDREPDRVRDQERRRC